MYLKLCGDDFRRLVAARYEGVLLDVLDHDGMAAGLKFLRERGIVPVICSDQSEPGVQHGQELVGLPTLADARGNGASGQGESVPRRLDRASSRVR